MSPETRDCDEQEAKPNMIQMAKKCKLIPSVALSPLQSRPKVVCIIGSSGIGKTALSIHLAKRLGGEVINADAMQVYRGLDIVTNKATTEERQDIPHHLLGTQDPIKEYSISAFTRDAIACIHDIHGRGRIPILVGGTHYYIQSVLWEVGTLLNPSENQSAQQLEGHDEVDEDQRHPSLVGDSIADEIEHALWASHPQRRTTQAETLASLRKTLYSLLQKVDPIMAHKWHPNEDRKCRRSLQVYYTTGKPHSWHYQRQREALSQPSASTSLRFDTCVFWLHMDASILRPRLDARVDEMIRLGMFTELVEMRAMVQAGVVAGTKKPADPSSTIPSDIVRVDHTIGVLQTIGFKEFQPLFEYLEEHGLPLHEAAALHTIDKAIQRLRDAGIERMKISTRQYAKRQGSWIRNKFLPLCLADPVITPLSSKPRVQLWKLDVGQGLPTWNRSIADVAVTCAESFLRGNSAEIEAPTLEDMLQESDKTALDKKEPIEWRKETCPVCVDESGAPKVANGPKEWEIHCQSRRHLRAIKQQSKVAELTFSS